MLIHMRRSDVLLLLAVAFAGCAPSTPQVVLATVEVTRVVSPTASTPVQPASTETSTRSATLQPTESPTPAPTQPPASPPPTPTPIVLVVVPIEGDPIMRLLFPDYTPAATTSLDFKVEARFGQDAPDGSGIAEVIFTIYNADGDAVYQRIERRSGFCAFGGGDPDCERWVFVDHNSRWPNGLPIENGLHEIEVTVRADPTFVDGGNNQWTSRRVPFEIQAPPAGPGLFAVIDAPQPGDLTWSNRAYFRVIAYDPSVGNQDGAGIGQVEMLIVENPSGRVVHQAVERTARYCAFGGNETCTEWLYSDNSFRWPSGQPIASGTHILRAVVQAQDGQTITVETSVDIQLGE